MTQPLRYAINVTLDGCCSHEAGLPPDFESMAFWTDELRRSDTLLYGRVTYELMKGAWRRPESGEWPDWMDANEGRVLGGDGSNVKGGGIPNSSPQQLGVTGNLPARRRE